MKLLFEIEGGQLGKDVLAQWNADGSLLAVVGKNRRCQIRNRNGEVIGGLGLKGNALQLSWDAAGETLAVLVQDSRTVMLWSHTDRAEKELDTQLKGPSFLCWSKSGPELAVGTDKGSLLVYNNRTKKSIPIMGKHNKRITCGAWSNEGKLALGSEDKLMTTSNREGETIHSAALKAVPSNMQFSMQKAKSNSREETTISLVMGDRSILLYNIEDPENPVELAFQARYGEVRTYQWYGDGYLMIGFDNGYVVAISTHLSEIGEELHSLQVHDSTLTDAVHSSVLGRIATIGTDKTSGKGSSLRMLSTLDWTEELDSRVDYHNELAEKLHWTDDGSILTVTTNTGGCYTYLMSFAQLSSSYGPRMALLSSLRIVSVINVESGQPQNETSISIAVEPSFMALGASHCAIGMNNHAWFYSTTDGSVVSEKAYAGTVNSICLNDSFVAVLSNQQCQLHSIVSKGDDSDREETFPEQEDAKVSAISLTNDFLVYATVRGTLHHFYLNDWASINEYRHSQCITAIFPNPQGTRVAFIDQLRKGFIYNPVDDSLQEIPYFPPTAESVVWDPADTNCFVVTDQKHGSNVITYTYSPQTTKGAFVNKSGTTKVPAKFSTTMMYDGMLHGLQSNALKSVVLSTHDLINAGSRSNAPEDSKRVLQQLLQLGRLKQAWDVAVALGELSKDQMPLLARKAMEHLDIDQAIRVYRQIQNTSMVLALLDIKHIEDKHLLAGHVSLLLGDYQKAGQLFLASSEPEAALHMRRDLLHWDQALSLAAQLAPKQIPVISREYAQQLEVKAEYAQALEYYEKAISSCSSDNEELPASHMRQAEAGIARTKLRLGDLGIGKRLAMESKDKHLITECAGILASMKQLEEAAELYMSAKAYEKAATIYITLKDFAKAAPLMGQITTPKLHAQYAKAKEASKQYAEAAVAYEKAKDYDSVIRLNLKYLEAPDKAFSMARRTGSTEGAVMVSTYCTNTRQFGLAIEFLLMAKLPDEAFQLATGHHKMETYAKVLGDHGEEEDYLNIAQYYESKKDWGNAGRYFALVKDYPKAMRLFLQAPGETFIDKAIDVVKKAQGQPVADQLFTTLHDYLVGEADAEVKDPNYIFRLYMAIGEYAEAAKTAILIAQQEQKIGNYAVARGILFDTHQDLLAHKITVPTELKKLLILLHSYTLVKKLVKAGDHKQAARMLIRVAKSISKFPSHVVPILTSTVIECQRAGLKQSSFEYASMLMRPEYRKKIDQRYARKIESIVRRKPAKEEEEPCTDCPICSQPLAESTLQCHHCRSQLPYCCTTGKHMTTSNWTICPCCRFPQAYQEFVDWIKAHDKCSMCNESVNPTGIQIIEDPKAFLKAELEAMEKKEEAEEEAPAAPAPPKKASW